MTWVSEYKSPFTKDGTAPTFGAHSDDQMSAIVLSLILGKDWVVRDVEDGFIRMCQRPPFGDWEWVFRRLDA